MPVYKRFKGKKVKRGNPDYDKATWIAAGMVDGTRYHKSLPKAKTKSDATEAEDLIIAGIRQGDFDFLRDKTNFTDFVDSTYLPYCKVNNSTYRQKTYECNYLKSFFKKRLLKAITPKMCEEYKQWRLAQKARCQKCIHETHSENEPCEGRTVQPSTVNRELTTLKKLFNVAVENRKLKESPMRFVKKLDEPAPRERFLGAEEKQRLLAACRPNPQLLAIVMLALLTGWRKDQILSVRKTDLDETHRAVSIKKSKQQAARKVPVSPLAWQIFAALAEKADDHLFVSRMTGEKLGDFKDGWWAALDKANIRDFHFHDLRHTFATDMLAFGARDFTIQAALGHANIKTTSGYTHVKNDYLVEALEAVSNHINFNDYTIFTPSDKTQ